VNFNRIKEIMIPTVSKRRSYYELVKVGISVFRREGLSEFLRKVKRWFHLRTSSPKIKIKLPKFDRKLEQDYLRYIKLINPDEHPLVSIIIPVHNNLIYTLNCLKSISDYTKEQYEVIMIDDCSTDNTFHILSSIPDIRLYKNIKNYGFIESCNLGASNSRGKLLLFLNNDTMVTSNWLFHLIETIKKDEVGAVGSKLLYFDGTLQSAGAIVFKDASAWLYGCHDNPDKPEYNFVRQVDYCSGACLLVKKELFDRVGGFDRRYKPAYFEDTDLCFAIRSIGYRVVYQPLSLVVHYEGISSGNDINTGVKRYQLINQPNFLEKWATTLTHVHYPPGSDNVFSARNQTRGRNILVLDLHIPTYDKDSGSLRMFNILSLLAELGHHVTFMGQYPLEVQPYTKELQQKGIEVIYSPYYPNIETYLRYFGKYFNYVILCRYEVAFTNMDLVKKYCPNARIIYDTVDLAFLRESRRAEIENNELLKQKAVTLKNNEIILMRKSDITLVVSQVEKDLLLKELPELSVEILSNIHQIASEIKPYSERKDLLFVGNFDHIPNRDACLWFTNEIFPSILSEIPSIKLYIVGNNPPREIKALSSEYIDITGYVENIRPYFEKCRVFVAPIRYGAGVKGKINQAMSYGLPVVTTSIGAEGISSNNELDLIISDEVNSFAQKTIQLYQNEKLWLTIMSNSLKNIKKYFSCDIAKITLNELFH
jgi:O-antigen biosynthesis protein